MAAAHAVTICGHCDLRVAPYAEQVEESGHTYHEDCHKKRRRRKEFIEALMRVPKPTIVLPRHHFRR